MVSLFTISSVAAYFSPSAAATRPFFFVVMLHLARYSPSNQESKMSLVLMAAAVQAKCVVERRWVVVMVDFQKM